MNPFNLFLFLLLGTALVNNCSFCKMNMNAYEYNNIDSILYSCRVSFCADGNKGFLLLFFAQFQHSTYEKTQIPIKIAKTAANWVTKRGIDLELTPRV